MVDVRGDVLACKVCLTLGITRCISAAVYERTNYVYTRAEMMRICPYQNTSLLAVYCSNTAAILPQYCCNIFWQYCRNITAILDFA